MRIDPKYFNKFVLLLAVVAALLIVFFTLFNQAGREQAFRRNVEQADSLRLGALPVLFETDSLRSAEFEDRFVVLNFWASWAPNVEREHRHLQQLKREYDDQLVVIAAAVEDTKEDVRNYMRKHTYPFRFVDGNKLFRDLNVPGIPAQIVYRPDGSLLFMNVGYTDSELYLPLEKELEPQSR